LLRSAFSRASKESSHAHRVAVRSNGPKEEEAMKISRRNILMAGGSTAMIAMASPWSWAQSPEAATSPDLIVHNAKVTTLQSSRPEAAAFAVRGERIVAVGGEADIMRLRTDNTRMIDAGGRRVIPGLNDSHFHLVRGGRDYNLELRWDGVESLQRGLQMIREQAKRTPAGHWVRVVGGWSPYQFREKRMPTVAELNDAAPDTPVYVLFAYSAGLLNRAGLAALGLTSDSKAPEGGSFEFVDGGAILRKAAAVYWPIGKLPTLSVEDQVNSTQHFFRELNRFGLTSAIDAGGTNLPYPDDYQALANLATRPGFPIRMSNLLFAQRPGTEREFYEKLSAEEKRNVNQAASRLNGYVFDGAGEVLVWTSADFEDFMAPRPELKPEMERELAEVTRFVARKQWPIRQHATYDQSVSRILDVFEPIFKETGYRARWGIDHAETISSRNIARIKAMGGGIAIQDRMAYAGEFFAERYGAEAAAHAPPIRQMLDAGLNVGAGTDGTRVASYNPWISLYWMVTGRTVGGTQLASPENRLTREEALRLYTVGSAWFSGEEEMKGSIAPGRFADFAILSADYLTVPEEEIRRIESVLTVTGGDVVYSAGPFTIFAPEPLPPVSPAWSPVAAFGGYQR
jgi:predicted amidohydrolase YtcJ